VFLSEQYVVSKVTPSVRSVSFSLDTGSHCFATHLFPCCIKYEGRSINKLQNDIILLIFKIWKFENIRFVGNLIGDKYWNFYDDDVITMTSLVLRLVLVRSQSVQYLPISFLLQLASVQQHCELNEKSEHVQQANMFKRKVLLPIANE